ncbi:DoxX family protein [Pseudonocardia parietis]|uniref:Membrane protein n=1 Tax=Pseudonocardia parietis TaxID=570936 RepID=A0ABS4W206_9PSEU|nr:MauE/DoxX family redox-associated membrane protein [Pseudonocardia parietis]MBP2369983.1 putative membrane protein [Pseudonocardia parietis]
MIHRSPDHSRRERRTALALAGLLGTAAVLHAARPEPFDSIVPTSLPGEPRFWTYASGVAEGAVAAALAYPRTRRAGGWAATRLLTAVFPANVSMALRSSGKAPGYRAIAWGRLPLQVPLVLCALRIARRPR